MACPPPSPLLDHPFDAPSSFQPEQVVTAVRSLRALPDHPVPAICVLDFDGDLTDWLIRRQHATPFEPWACFHTHMHQLEVDGQRCGIIPRTIGGPYAVLIAEQLLVSGVQLILGLTSAGRIAPALALPSLVIVDGALRDEGTSLHYLPAADFVSCPTSIASFLLESLAPIGLPVAQGAVWTTDAPYRETRPQIDRHAQAGILAVEMQAASLFAFATVRRVSVGIVAHLTNGDGHSQEQFDKGADEVSFDIVKAMVRAGHHFLARQPDRQGSANGALDPSRG